MIPEVSAVLEPSAQRNVCLHNNQKLSLHCIVCMSDYLFVCLAVCKIKLYITKPNAPGTVLYTDRGSKRPWFWIRQITRIRDFFRFNVKKCDIFERRNNGMFHWILKLTLNISFQSGVDLVCPLTTRLIPVTYFNTCEQIIIQPSWSKMHAFQTHTISSTPDGMQMREF